MNDLKNLAGKQVKIFLKSGNIMYHGKIISAGDVYVQIVDKYDKIVYIVIDSISSIEEEKA